MQLNIRTIPISWEEIDQVVFSLAEKVQQDGNPKIIVGIQRGGLIPGVLLSHYLNIRDLLSLNIIRTINDSTNAEKMTPTLGRNIPLDEITNKDVLLVDDIVGTGETIKVAQNTLSKYSPYRVRSLVLFVNRDNWDIAKEDKPSKFITYIGREVRGWVVFPWERGPMAEMERKIAMPVPKIVSSTNYSTAQMDNFYKALANGIVKTSGVMNYMLHLFIAKHCPKGASVLDIGCGRSLLLPLLKRYAPNIAHYVGIDISDYNLQEARNTISKYNPPFSCSLIHGDVTRLSTFIRGNFDIVVYTSTLEHMDKRSGVISLEQVSRVLANNGTLFLSTPITPDSELQYKVHIYEWDNKKLKKVLKENGLKILKIIGLLPPSNEILKLAIKLKFGTAGITWYQEMQDRVPHEFLSPIVTTCFPNVAKEVLYICKRGRQL